MDQWLWYNPEPSRNRWDGGLEDFFGGLEEEGWCLACGEFGHLVACCPFQEEEDLLPAQKRKRRRGGRSRRRTKEPGPSPVWKMEVVPTIAPSERAPQPERAPPPSERAPQPERAPPPSERALPPPVLRAPAKGVSQQQESPKPLLLPEREPPLLLPEREPLLLPERETLLLQERETLLQEREPPPEREMPPLSPEREPLPPALLRELPLKVPVLLRAPARGATKGQEQREPLPHEGEHLWPESELLILGYRESLRPAEDSSLPSAQHGTPALPPKALEGKPDMRGGGLCFRGGGCRSRSYVAWRPVNFLGTKKAKVGVV
ncbi:UNVERIFIED_CONTAM: hypothetical protein FKN15_012512 [Acipenser sinensis]